MDFLRAYRDKRDFSATTEPEGGWAKARRKAAGNRFVVQKHAARRLHYDLRLELDGVLKSWAVPQGPSLVPGKKRLAVHTEDHPLEYLAFEGVIPKGEYGGGTMIVWDRGRWAPEGDPRAAYAKGRLTFALNGERLNGRWHLVRTRGRPGQKREQWLLFKAADDFSREEGEPEITEEETTSLISRRTNDELAAAGEVRRDHIAREKVARSRGSALPDPSPIRGARRSGILPVFVPPSLAAPAAKPPAGTRWLHEILHDGLRLQARIDGRKVRLIDAERRDRTKDFKHLREALKAEKLGSALIDGVAVVEDEAGLSRAALLEAALEAGRGERVRFHAFDLLYLEGWTLGEAALADRKALLAAILDGAGEGAVRFSEHMEGGAAVFRHACRLGAKGIVSKRRDGAYISGAGDWISVNCPVPKPRRRR